MGKIKILLFILAASLVVSGCIVRLNSNNTPVIAGVFKSVSQGDTWFERNVFLHPKGVGSIGGVGVKSFIFDPQDEKTIYLASLGSGLLFSYDTADSWQKLSAFGDGKVESMAVDPQDKCTLYATRSNTLVKSTDCGRSWLEVFIDAKSDNKLTAVALDSFNDGVIYVGDAAGDVFQSDDWGSTWRSIYRTTSPIVKILINPKDTRVIYVATNRKGIFKSSDAGNSWADINADLKKYSGALEYKHLMFDTSLPDSLLYVAKYGLLKTDDGGITWSPITLITPPATTDILAAVINPDDNRQIFYTSRTTFYKTNDGGANWVTKRLPSKAVPTFLSVDPANSNILYLGFTQPPKD